GETFPLNGDLLSLGSFEEVLLAGTDKHTMEMGGTFLLEDIWDHGPYRTLEPDGSVRVRRTTRDTRSVVGSWTLTLKGSPKSEPGSTYVHQVHLSVSEEQPETPWILNLTATHSDDEADTLPSFPRGIPRTHFFPLRSWHFASPLRTKP